MQLPARYERPSLLVELACKQRIATGEELGGSLGEPHAGIGFHSRHKSLAGQVRELARLFGGQGTLNVPSWSPDCKRRPKSAAVPVEK